MAAQGGRLRYTRDKILALKDVSASVELPLNPVPLKMSKPYKKKSQSSETDGMGLPENGHLGSDGQSGSRRQRLWHQNIGRGQHSSNMPSHHRQRYPSGPHGDTGESDAAAFRPAGTGNSRSSQKVWSTGCAGWRQRSYSGSESFGTTNEPNYTRGRIGGFDGSADCDSSASRWRRHRGALSGWRRPVSFIHPSTSDAPGTRVHSQSCSIDPPPGFELPPLHDAPDPSQDSASNVPKEEDSHQLTDTQWYYIDTSGQMQGPFGNEQMATWLTKGYLPLHIEIRRQCDECFLPLLNHLALAGRIPFWKGYAQPPITRTNLASILIDSGSSVSSPLWMNHPSLPNQSASTIAAATPTEASLPSVPDLASTEHLTGSSVQQSDHLAPLPENTTPAEVVDLSVTQLPDSSSNTVLNNHEILRLCTEAQALAIHAAKVDAERQELAERLSAISSTAAKLLSVPPNVPSLGSNVLIPSSQPSSDLVNEQSSLTSESVPLGIVSEVGVECESRDENLDPSLIGQSTPPSSLEPPLSEVQKTDQLPMGTTDGKTSKKKNKKAKKAKLTQEQERQQAWDAEFERRKAVALQKKLAEEEEEKRLKVEEAAALAAEQAAIAKEQKRLLKERHQQELLRAKAEKELAQLKLPHSARWGTSTTPASRDAAVGLADIQVAQALEEAERCRQHTMAQQVTLSAAAEKRTERPVTAWASVVGGNNRPVVHPETASVCPPATVADSPAPNSKAAKQMPKPPDQGNRPTTQASKSAATRKPTNQPTVRQKNTPPSDISIWDLQTSQKNVPGNKMNSKNAKKNKKKHNSRSNEAKSFAAKEQLAHWCESQLSSMPLSGVDLPTLVDLLCELETADQVIECIETSLGRSTLTSKFSKAFLEKRECILTGIL